MSQDLICGASDCTLFAESVPYDSLLIEWTSDFLSYAADSTTAAAPPMLVCILVASGGRFPRGIIGLTRL